MRSDHWRELAAQQHGLLARRQLNALGLDHNYVRHQVAAERWALRTPTVVSTTTGALTFDQRVWLGVLHAGRDASVAGMTALRLAGLEHWERPEVTIMVPQSADIEPVAGIRFQRTRRDLDDLSDVRTGLRTLAVEPAALLVAGYGRSARAGCGLLAATVQQRLTTATRLATWIDRLQPLRRARLFRSTLGAIEGGAQSMAELDVGRICRRFGLPAPTRQVRRRERSGRLRFTDCEWRLPDGRLLVLEVDGAFHMAADQWADDLARARGLAATGAVVVRCTAQELRFRPGRVMADLRALGLATHPGRAAEASG
jgi:hypothetical protein